MIEGSSISNFFSSINPFSAKNRERILAFFFGKKVSSTPAQPTQLPSGSNSSHQAGEPLGNRQPEAREGTQPSVNIPQPQLSEQEARQAVFQRYSPGGQAYDQAMRQKGITDVPTDLLADYADGINKSANKVPAEKLEGIASGELLKLVQAVESQSTASAQSTAKPEAPQLIPLDSDLPPAVAAIKWLHVNQAATRRDFNDLADRMVHQSNQAVEKYRAIV